MFHQIEVDALARVLETPGTVIADVRDSDSYEAGHLDGAEHFSVTRLNTFCQTAERAKPIVVYCHHGISSQSVAQHLVEQGFKQVYSLVGGFEAWKARQETSAKSGDE